MDTSEDIKPIAPVHPLSISNETNSNYAQLIENFEKNIIGNRDSSDVTVKCNGKDFYCFQNCLSAKSPVFKAMFQTMKNDENTGSNEKLVLEEIEFSNDVVKRILFYLYSGIEPDVDNWGKEMFLFAQKYQLEDLTMSLGSKLISTLNDDNCIEYMKLGDLVHVKELKEASLRFIMKDLDSYFEKKNWKKDFEQLSSSLRDEVRKEIFEKANSSHKDRRPRGFARGLEPERILKTSSNDNGEPCFLIKWKNCEDEDLVPAKEVNIKIPQLVIKFYEERFTFIDKHIEEEEESDRKRLVI